MTEHRDISEIRSDLRARRDIFLLAKSDAAPIGQAPIVGQQLRRVKETEVRAPDSYHPHTYVGWKYYGQSFAVERPIRGKLSRAQATWKAVFENTGGIYIEAESLEDVEKVLGKQPDDIDAYLARAPLKRF